MAKKKKPRRRERFHYSQKYKDPRWQKTRLRIFQRDDFKCQRCNRSDVELQVHHWYYQGDPWETPDHLLLTTCKPCHSTLDEVRKDAAYMLAQTLALADPTFFNLAQCVPGDCEGAFISFLSGAVVSGSD